MISIQVRVQKHVIRKQVVNEEHITNDKLQQSFLNFVSENYPTFKSSFQPIPTDKKTMICCYQTDFNGDMSANIKQTAVPIDKACKGYRTISESLLDHTSKQKIVNLVYQSIMDELVQVVDPDKQTVYVGAVTLDVDRVFDPEDFDQQIRFSVIARYGIFNNVEEIFTTEKINEDSFHSWS